MRFDSPKTAAERIGRSEGHIRRLCAQGKIANSNGERPEKLPSGAWIIPKDAVPTDVNPVGRPKKEVVG